MMDIVLDNIVFSLQRAGGISVVWQEQIQRLIRDTKLFSCEFIEYQGATNNIFRSDLILDNIDTRSSSGLMLKRYLSPNYKKNQAHIFHSSYYRTSGNKKALNVTTVHDFTYEYFYKGSLAQKVHTWQKNKAIENSDAIICVSENTKSDLIHFLPNINPQKIFVVHNGVSSDFRIIDISNSTLPFASQSYVLYVGARGGYKNFGMAVEACAHTGYNLIMVGGGILTDSERELLNSKLTPNKYKLLLGIENTSLNELYNGAFCLIYPSLYEGFGIPVIEAQKAGCPIIAAKCSSLPEISGENNLLIENISTNLIIDNMQKLSNDAFRKQLIMDGQKNAERFTWDNTYYKTIEIYKSLLCGK